MTNLFSKIFRRLKPKQKKPSKSNKRSVERKARLRSNARLLESATRLSTGNLRNALRDPLTEILCRDQRGRTALHLIINSYFSVVDRLGRYTVDRLVTVCKNGCGRHRPGPTSIPGDQVADGTPDAAQSEDEDDEELSDVCLTVSDYVLYLTIRVKKMIDMLLRHENKSSRNAAPAGRMGRRGDRISFTNLLNTPDDEFRTPLYMAIFTRFLYWSTGPSFDKARCTTVAQTGDLSSDATKTPETPRHFVEFSMFDVIRHLIVNGADLTHRTDVRGRTPLHLAAAYGDMCMTKYLISVGADVNVVDDRKWSPLDYALMSGVSLVGEFLAHMSFQLPARKATDGPTNKKKIAAADQAGIIGSSLMDEDNARYPPSLKYLSLVRVRNLGYVVPQSIISSTF